jgi:hypothetical protein
MQRRKSNFARLEQPEDVRRKILQTFSAALDEMEALLRAEGYVLDDEIEGTESAEDVPPQPVPGAPAQTAALAPSMSSDIAGLPTEGHDVMIAQESDGQLDLNLTVVESVMNLFKSMGHFIDNNIISIAKMVRSILSVPTYFAF